MEVKWRYIWGFSGNIMECIYIYMYMCHIYIIYIYIIYIIYNIYIIYIYVSYIYIYIYIYNGNIDELSNPPISIFNTPYSVAGSQ